MPELALLKHMWTIYICPWNQHKIPDRCKTPTCYNKYVLREFSREDEKEKREKRKLLLSQRRHKMCEMLFDNFIQFQTYFSKLFGCQRGEPWPPKLLALHNFSPTAIRICTPDSGSCTIITTTTTAQLSNFRIFKIHSKRYASRDWQAGGRQSSRQRPCHRIRCNIKVI